MDIHQAIKEELTTLGLSRDEKVVQGFSLYPTKPNLRQVSYNLYSQYEEKFTEGDETIKEKIEKAMRCIRERGVFTLGPELEQFEKNFALYCNSLYAVGVNSGTDALKIALLASEVQPGDEVIVPTLTFIASADAVSFIGAKPVFVDVDESGNIDPAKITELITTKTKAIIGVHLWGQPANMDKLMDIGRRYAVKVIEDASHAHGAVYQRKKIGSIGDVSCFSFHPRKNLGAEGDGGIVVTNNHELAERLTLLRNHGRIGNYNHVMLGTNTRLDETQAAVLNIKLPFLDTWNRRRRKHALTYTDKIMGAGLTVSFPKEYDVEQTSVYHQYVIRLNDKHIRDALRTYLISRGVDAKIHYPVPLHRTPAYQFMNYGTGTFPVAESLCDTILSLPMYPQLTDEDITYVVAVMKEFFEYCKDVTITPFVMFPDILIKRGYTPIHIYSKGGSSAKVFLALSPYNEKVVIKYCDWDGISGNGIPWLISQAKKLKMIQETWPDDLSIYYSRIRELYYDGNVAFYAMEYHEGAQDITEYFFNPEVTEDDMIQNIDNIIKVLVNTHYKRHIEAYPNEIEKNFVVREKHRMELLVQHNGKVYEHLLKGRPFKFSGMYEKDATYFFEKLMQQELIVINGRILPNLPALMKIFEEKVEYFQEKYGPTHHSQYAHGDLPLRNIFRMQDGSIRITDVRSNNGDVTSPNKFSVEFDIGKIAHSFLLELVRNRHYEFSGSRDNGIYVFNYRFHDLPEIRKFRNVWRKFPDIVRNNTALLELFECSSTDWMKHIMLAESINYACDVIHRFSNDPSGHDSLIYYLYATEALYAFLESEELEPHVRQDSDYTWWTQSVQRVEATPS